MMKKLLSLLLAASTMLLTASALGAESTPMIYLNYDFNNEITNSVPAAGGITISGSAETIIREYAPLDKALLINKKDGASSSLSMPVSITGNAVFQFDIMLSGAHNAGNLTFSNSSAEFSPLNFGATGEIKTASGKKIGTMRKDRFMNIAVVYRKSLNFCDVYIDGKCVLYGWRLENKMLSSVSKIGLSFKQSREDSEIYIDNIRAYSGDALCNDFVFPKSVYNSKAEDYTEPGEKTFDEILLQCDYEGTTVGSMAQKSNIIERITEKNEDGTENKYLQFKGLGAEDYFVDFMQTALTPDIVYQMDFKGADLKASVQLFTLILNPDRAFNFVAYANPGGTISLENGRVVGSFGDGRWHNVAIAVDYVDKKYDFYFDRRLVAEDVSMMIRNKENPSAVRIYSGASVQSFAIDNVYFYEGKVLRDIASETAESGSSVSYERIKERWTKDEVVIRYLGDAFAVSAASGAVYSDGAKTYPGNSGFIRDKVIYLPLRMVAENLGHSVSWDDASKSAIYDDNTYVTVGSRSITAADGTVISLESDIVLEGGILYAPLEAYGEGKLCDIKVTSDINGVVLFGARDYSAAESKEIAMFMGNVRPDSEKIQNDYKSSSAAGQHPRIFARQSDFDRMKSLVETDPNAKAIYEGIKKNADKLMTKPLDYWHLTDGLRMLETARNVLSIVYNCGMVYKISGDTAYADRVWREVENVALNFPNWNPNHYLDVGELSMAMGVAYDWLYDYLSEDKKETLRLGMKHQGLDLYLSEYQAKAWWSTLDSNWTFVTNGGGIAMALALADDYPQECFALIENALRDIEPALLRYAPDGGWYEGPGYWGYAAQYLCYMIASMDSALEEDYGLKRNAGISDTMNYFLYITGVNNLSFSFSDCMADEAHFADYGNWFSHAFDQPSWMKIRTDLVAEGKTTGDVIDLIYYNPEAYANAGDIDLPLDMYFRNSEVAASRSSWTDNNMLWLGYKGGIVNQSHGQYDNGSFEFDLNGVRWARELPREDYNLPGFGDLITSYYVKRAEGHNTLVINPGSVRAEQDPNEYATISGFKSSPTESIGIVELSNVYKQQAKSVRRGFKVADFRKSLTIRDEMELLGDDNTVYWFMHTNIIDENDITITGNTAVLRDAGTGRELHLEFITDAAESELSVMDFVPLPSSPNPTQMKFNNKKIVIKLQGKKKMNLTVKMTDNSLYELGHIEPISDASLDEWTVSDREVPGNPKIDNIYIDGKLIEGFNPAKTEYRILKKFTDPDAVVTYDGGEEYDVSMRKVGEITTITVSNKEYPAIYTSYSITVKKIPDIYESLDDFKIVKPALVEASRVPQPENPPESLLDGDVNTRFAVDGNNEWVQFDMGSVVDIDCYAISYYMGTQRDSYYDILISNDGEKYETIFKGATSGLTDYYELFDKPLSFRYFKLVGHQNTLGPWNSPTEISFLRKK